MSSDSKTNSSASSSTSRSRKAEVNEDEAQSLKLSKSIAEFNKNVGLIEKSLKDAREVADNYLNDFDEKVKIKKRKVDDMEEDFKLQHKNKELELSNSIKESGYNKAVEILASRNPKEIAVTEAAWTSVNAKVIQLEREMKQAISDEVAKYKSNLDRDFRYNEETSKLKQCAETSKIQALVAQKDDHIKVLTDQIMSLKHEVDMQRKLTQSISESFSNAQKTTVVSSNDSMTNRRRE